MAKIRVKVKPGQILSLVDGTYKAGAELDMDEKDAEPILGSCISKIGRARPEPKPKTPSKKQEPADEKETV